MPADAPDGGFAHHRVERSTHTPIHTEANAQKHEQVAATALQIKPTHHELPLMTLIVVFGIQQKKQCGSKEHSEPEEEVRSTPHERLVRRFRRYELRHVYERNL